MEEEECDSEYNTENDSEVEDSAGVPKEKKAKVGRGAAKYTTRFDPSWTATYPCVKGIKNDKHSFLCTVCNKKISCKHQGVQDVKRHVNGQKHKTIAQAAVSQPKLSFQGSSSSTDEKVRT